MTGPALDHLVVAAAVLSNGVAALEAAAGIAVAEGGAHPAMATHNRLTRIAPASYLEVIAPDPTQPAPLRPRWFGLDEPGTAERLRAGPALLTWVVRVPDLDRALAESPVDLGRPLDMTRGALHWRIAVRDNGSLPENGTVPTLIQWPDGAGPAATIPDAGLRLGALRLTHPDPDRIRAVLAVLGVDGLVALAGGAAAGLTATLHGPGGRTITLR
ncbi:MAG: hypothetical protein JWR08_2541 [Enterovirga sp.]|nr:hypothetical protein [Enterovirga sp.]